jgi:hypothetical protein
VSEERVPAKAMRIWLSVLGGSFFLVVAVSNVVAHHVVTAVLTGLVAASNFLSPVLIPRARRALQARPPKPN